MKVDLEVVEVLGFGEIGQSKDRQAILDYVEQRHQEQFKAQEERGVRPIRKKSHLFHAALVFLSVTNHGINRSELQLMKELQSRVAVIPIVSKTDMLLPVEYEGLKVQVRDALKREGAATGNTDAARSYYSQALAIDPGHAGLKEALSELTPAGRARRPGPPRTHRSTVTLQLEKRLREATLVFTSTCFNIRSCS